MSGRYSVGVFGARSGYIIHGDESMPKGIKLRLLSDIPPSSICVNNYISKYGWDQLTNTAKNLPFYRSMRQHEIRSWITNNSVKYEYMDDVTPSPTIEVLDIDSNDKLIPFIEKTSDADKTTYTINEVQSMLETRTLVFKVTHWKIMLENYDYNPSPDDIVIRNGKLEKAGSSTGENFYKIKDFIIACDKPDTVHVDLDEDAMSKIKTDTSYYTASGYKSLLQKIIRYSAHNIMLASGDKIPIATACQIVFYILFTHKGSFVPDLQRFVRGTESALKRLAIIIVEDSWIDDLDIISDLLAHAYVAQNVSGWKPSNRKVHEWLNIIPGVCTQNKYFEYSHFIPICNDKHLSTMLLQSIGSFESDIQMFHSVTTEYFVGNMEIVERKDIMHTHHAIDQHWTPQMVYLYPIEYIRKHAINGPKPYRQVFALLWDKSSSLNPRRKRLSELDDVIVHVQRRYHMFNIGKIPANEHEYTGNVKYTFEYPESYISSIVGPIYTSSPIAMVTMNTRDIRMLVASRKPSRGATEAKLTPIHEEQAIANAKIKLQKGINGVKLVDVDTMEYTVNNINLEEFLMRKATIRSFKYDCNASFISSPNDEDVSVASYDMVIDIIKNMYTQEEIYRALYYIRMADSEIKFLSISRDGGGVKLYATRYDTAAYDIINRIAYMFPFALKISKDNMMKFIVHNQLFINDFGDKLIAEHSSDVCNIDCRDIWDRDNRKPYEHQIETLNEMIDGYGKPHFIWIPVGMGKTMIVMSYLQYLLCNNKCGKYILYTLPKSAIGSITSEIERFGFNINMVSTKNKKIEDNAINMIEHDQLRRLNEELMSVAPKSVIIIDEVHKLLANTQRTSTGLNIASLAKDFVAMTGTPMINSDMSLLLNWLKLVVDYPLNRSNFWISINSLISKPVNTGVIVNTRDVGVEMTCDETERYYSLVGKSLGGSNDSPVYGDIQKAMDICYDAVDRDIVKLAIDTIDDGVFIVTRNIEHQNRIRDMLIRKGVNECDVGLINKDNTYYLERPDTPGPRIVITVTRKSEGYTLTKMGVMITSVYFSNTATREQLDGRINRVSQVRKEVYKYTLFTGLLGLIMQKYKHAQSLVDVMRDFAW